LSSDVWNWYEYFTATAPLDPYTINAVLFDFHQRPFEKQQRLAGNTLTFGPGVANYEISLLDLVYESQGCRYIPGYGTVKEDQRPRLEQVPIGVLRSFTGTAGEGTLQWAISDGGSGEFPNALYYGEHPHCEVGSREITLTFPFAPTGAEPFGEGTVNSDSFQLPVTGDVYAPGQLKYMGCAKEASVVVPSVGVYTGLVRYRKSFIFHLLKANLGIGDSLLTWNHYFRARDQSVEQILDMNGRPYTQYGLASFSTQNWWL